MKKLAIVVPCYNEEEVFEDTKKELTKVLISLIEKNKISSNSFLLFVDDGSKDKTWNLIEEAHKTSKNIYGLKLVSNRGHQNALFAGLMFAKDNADVSISIDADLQDDTKVIEEMVDKYNEGFDIVYGVRNDRTTDTFFKRTTANLFYKLMKALGSKAIENSADFRLLSKRVLEELSLYEEYHLFLRGLVPSLGYKQTCVYYKRSPRLKGESKYPFKKMLSFAFDGVTSFSDVPLNIILYLGFFSIIVSFISIIYSLIRHIQGNTIVGWTSLFISLWFIGGLILISLGVVGKYVGKTFIESKKRPRYYIETILSYNKSGGKKK